MRPLIAGNWKMHGMAPQLAEIEAIAASVKAAPPFADLLICLPATLIARAAQAAAGRIAIGGEDCSAEVSGAFTGDISAEMLKGAGASAVIVGHSERRQHHAETDAIVAAKAKAAQRAGLLVIICIGETKSQRLDGDAFDRNRSYAYLRGDRGSSRAHSPMPRGALRRARKRGAHPLRWVGQTFERARHPGTPGSRRRVGRRSKLKGRGLRGNFPDCRGDGLTARGRSKKSHADYVSNIRRRFRRSQNEQRPSDRAA
jgi:hypothetical protein